MSWESPEAVRAFNRGSQARIGGEPFWNGKHLPYKLRRWWEKGWEHADKYWGADNPLAVALPPPAGQP